MSTESEESRVKSAEHSEYGPTPPDAKYEHTDIDPAVGYKFALWLSVAMVLSFGIVYGAFWFFERQASSANQAAQQYPLAKDFERPQPTPALQTQPFKDIATLRQGEADRLGSYGWVDKDGGVARIPIDRAMEVLLQRGLPIRPDAPAGAKNAQDSSSGR
jgi:hypothetical protein